MVLSVQQVMDYIKCPMLYKYRYIDQIELYTEQELFQNALKQVTDQIYYNLLDGTITNKAQAKYKWGDAWDLQVEKNKIMWMNNDIKRRLQMRGLEIVLGIQNYISQTKPYPISINEIYGIQLGEHRLETNMSYVQENTNKINLIEYVVNEYTPDETTLINNLYITAKVMIFEDLFKVRLNNVLYYSTKNNTVYPTVRNLSDFKEVKDTVSNIAYCIEKNIYYKQYADSCKTCMYNRYCNR